MLLVEVPSTGSQELGNQPMGPAARGGVWQCCCTDPELPWALQNRAAKPLVTLSPDSERTVVTHRLAAGPLSLAHSDLRGSSTSTAVAPRVYVHSRGGRGLGCAAVWFRPQRCSPAAGRAGAHGPRSRSRGRTPRAGSDWPAGPARREAVLAAAGRPRRTAEQSGGRGDCVNAAVWRWQPAPNDPACGKTTG